MAPITAYSIVHAPPAPPSTPPGGGPYVNNETNSFYNNVTPTPSPFWLTAMDTLITSLKSAGVWQTLDLFYCFAAPSQSACTYNWVNIAVGQLTANGSITYSTNAYANSDGSTGWFSSSFNVNSGHAVNGNSEFGHFCLNEDSTDNVSVFATSGGISYTSLQTSSTAINNMTGALNTSTSGSWSSQWGSTTGHWVLQQEDTSSTLEAFLDGSSLGTSVQTTSADSGTVQIFKSSSGSFTTRQTSFVHYGSKLTAAQQLVLSKALYTFLTAMNVRPLAGYLGLSSGPTNVAPYKHVSTGNGNNLTVPETTSSATVSGLLQGRAGSYPYSMIRVNDPNYLNIWRYEIHDGDYAPFDSPGSVDRIQLHTQENIALGSTCDLSFSFWIENGSVPGSSFTDINALHDQTSGVNCGPTNGILPNGQFYVWLYWTPTGTYTNFTGVNCPQGQWHHLRTTWTFGSGNGVVQSWLDGTQIVNFTGNVGNPSGAPFYQNMDLYRNTTTSPFAIWFANFEFDSSGTQPFSGRVANPLPCPPLT